MKDNEIVIDGVHHVLVDGGLSDCSDCSLKGICHDSLGFARDTLCHLVYKDNCIDKHFEIKEEK